MTTDSLIVDVSGWQGDRLDWPTFLAAAGPWADAGVIAKVSEGSRAPTIDETALAHRQLAPARAAGRVTGCYHYLHLGEDGAAQAERYYSSAVLAGGEGPGSLPCALDVERAGQRPADLARARVGDVVVSFVERYQQLSGRSPILYGGELLRAIGARSLFGCSGLWLSHYAARLDLGHGTADLVLATAGCPLERLLLWQYIGGGDSPAPFGYPRTAPGLGKVDISVVVASDGLDSLLSLTTRHAQS